MSRRAFTAIVLIITAGAVLSGIASGCFFLLPRCPMKVLTGWDCPFCGLLRGTHALLRGNISEALSYNLLLPLILILLAAAVAATFLPDGSLRLRLRRLLLHRATVSIVFIALAAWMAVRNVWCI